MLRSSGLMPMFRRLRNAGSEECGSGADGQVAGVCLSKQIMENFSEDFLERQKLVSDAKVIIRRWWR